MQRGQLIYCDEVVCTTGPRGHQFRDYTVSVTAHTTGAAVLDATVRTWFRYLDLWSARTTWTDDELPAEGDTVVIPHGQAVVLDVSPPELFALIVEGVLVFDPDAATPLNLDATYIFVFGGVFEVGTEAAPFMGEATITLHGDRWDTVELPMVGAKMIAVTDYPFVKHSHTGSDDGDGGGEDGAAPARRGARPWRCASDPTTTIALVSSKT